MAITLLTPYQSVDGTWYVPWTDGVHRNELKYLKALSDEGTIRADVQMFLDKLAAIAVSDAQIAKQAALDQKKAAFAAMEFAVVGKDGKPVLGATVKAVDAETKDAVGQVVTAGTVTP